MMVAILCGAIALSWHHRTLHRVLVGTLVAATAVLMAPLRTTDGDALRQNYVESLLRYEGTRYVWGGETSWGIDCSGLMRRAMINALVRTAITSGNPGLLRSAVILWWNDCTANELGSGFGHRTVPITKADSVNSLDPDFLKPGDLAVVAEGVHVLAYVGDHTWIEANPEQQRVVIEIAPLNSNHWLQEPAVVVRWTSLNGGREVGSNSKSDRPR